MSKNKISKKKISEIKKIFLEEKQKIQESLSNKSNDFVETDGGDETDITQANIINQLQGALSQRDLLRIKRIDEALLKIDKDDNFGMCEECDEPISEKRLIAIPGCKQCISCAEIEEKYNKINGL